MCLACGSIGSMFQMPLHMIGFIFHKRHHHPRLVQEGSSSNDSRMRETFESNTRAQVKKDKSANNAVNGFYKTAIVVITMNCIEHRETMVFTLIPA